MPCQVAFGESHKLVGAHPSLGGWNPDNAPAMCWNDGDVWTLDLDLPPDEDVEFKVQPYMTFIQMQTVKKQLMSMLSS